MFTKKPAIVFKDFIGKTEHAEELRKILVLSTPRLKMVSPGLIEVNQMPLKDNVSKCLNDGKAVSEALV